MYYPYVKGTQFVFLALRELYAQKRIGRYVIPVIEPARYNASIVSLFDRIREPFLVIANPQTGTFNFDYAHLMDDNLRQKLQTILDHHPCKFGTRLPLKDDTQKPAWHQTDNDAFCFIEEDMRDPLPPYGMYIATESRTVRRRIPKDAKSVILARRSKPDTGSNIDEFFSEEHLYFKEEGFNGFCDRSIIDENPIGIHLVYFDDEQCLRVHHFYPKEYNSDDLSGMYQQTCKTIASFVEAHHVERTLGLNQLLLAGEEGRFPWYGPTAQYMLMHHLELMEWYFIKTCPMS